MKTYRDVYMLTDAGEINRTMNTMVNSGCKNITKAFLLTRSLPRREQEMVFRGYFEYKPEYDKYYLVLSPLTVARVRETDMIIDFYSRMIPYGKVAILVVGNCGVDIYSDVEPLRVGWNHPRVLPEFAFEVMEPGNKEKLFNNIGKAVDNKNFQGIETFVKNVYSNPDIDIVEDPKERLSEEITYLSYYKRFTDIEDVLKVARLTGVYKHESEVD